jgi:hypothetical protein
MKTDQTILVIAVDESGCDERGHSDAMDHGETFAPELPSEPPNQPTLAEWSSFE